MVNIILKKFTCEILFLPQYFILSFIYCISRRYCLLNDSDSSLTAEEAFRVYVEQMRHEGALPRLCESRRQLVDRFIFDMKVTNGLIDLWNYNAKTCKKYGISYYSYYSFLFSNFFFIIRLKIIGGKFT